MLEEMLEEIGDKVKYWESLPYQDRLVEELPIIARIDGRAFHSFTRSLDKPYDKNFMSLMSCTTAYLAKLTNAYFAYTQSDEINLVMHESFFDRRVQKITSVLAAEASVFFNSLLPNRLPTFNCRLPVFDCRVFNIPSKYLVYLFMLWREADAIRNSLSMLARNYFSHKQLLGKNSNEVHDMLYSVGVNWNDEPNRFKIGHILQKTRVVRPFTANEIENLPPKHAAREDSQLTFERIEYKMLERLKGIKNPEEVIFEGETPNI